MSKKEKFSLKDHLFNKPRIEKLSKEIKKAYPKFESVKFASEVLRGFNKLELKQRIERIADCLVLFLPKDYDKALSIILKSLPPPCDPVKLDDDFGDFIYEPFNLFIAKNGCNKKYLIKSLKALEQTTQRFSAEFALRFLITDFEKETLKVVKSWTKHKHYHVRRLASEGIRPNLPWGGKIKLSPKIIISILDNLYFDKTRYVTRSVANNLNDISKIDPKLVLDTLRRWRSEGKQNEAEFEYIEKHALRTLIKQGDKSALTYLGYQKSGGWKVKKISFSKEVKIGERFYFDCEFELKKGNYIIDYIIHYSAKNGSLKQKVFKAKKITIPDKESICISKKHLFENMTTRKISSGSHFLEFQVNGIKSKTYKFEVLR